jgi:putative ABC transport system permease protein
MGRIELDLADVDEIATACPAVARVSPLVRRPLASARAGNREHRTLIEAVSADYLPIRNFTVAAGRPFGALDVLHAQPVCILGTEVARRLGFTPSRLDEVLWLEGRRFRVIGLLAEKGSFFGVSQDDLVLIPYTTGLKLYPNLESQLAVAASATSEADVPEAKAQIQGLLRRRHRLAADQPNDFQLRTQDEVLQIFENVATAALAVLVGVVGVSLLVGGIGIMNVMLVSVTERTREIGLRKAVGATRRDILAQFLAEAVTLSLIGGAIGTAFGCGVCTLAGLHPQMIAVDVPWWAIALGFGISASTGVLFGLLPATKAALLAPIDALRHE